MYVCWGPAILRMSSIIIQTKIAASLISTRFIKYHANNTNCWADRTQKDEKIRQASQNNTNTTKHIVMCRHDSDFVKVIIRVCASVIPGPTIAYISCARTWSMTIGAAIYYTDGDDNSGGSVRFSGSVVALEPVTHRTMLGSVEHAHKFSIMNANM